MKRYFEQSSNISSLAEVPKAFVSMLRELKEAYSPLETESSQLGFGYAYSRKARSCTLPTKTLYSPVGITYSKPEMQSST